MACLCLRMGNKFERAAEVVLHAQHGRQPVSNLSPSAVLAQRIYHHPVYVVALSAIMLAGMVLATWEPPSNGEPTRPRLRIGVRLADAAYLTILALDLCLVQYLYYGGAAWRRRGWTRFKLVLLAAMVLNLALSASMPTRVPYIARMARPVFFIERFRSVRRVALNIARTVRAWTSVMLLIALHVLLFSVLGFALFAGVTLNNCVPFRAPNSEPQACSAFAPGTCSDYFNTLENSAMQLFQLVTMANYPNVAIPAYQCNRASAFFFVAFIVIGVYLLLSLTLAVTVAAFKALMAEEVVARYRREFEGYDLAFAELCVGSGGGAGGSARALGDAVAPPLAAASPFFSAKVPAADAAGLASTPGGGEDGGPRLQRPDFLRFFAALRRDVDSECAGLFFDTLDPRRRGDIGKLAFRRLLLNFGRLSVTNRRLHVVRLSGPAGGASGGSDVPRQGAVQQWGASGREMSGGGGGGAGSSLGGLDGGAVADDSEIEVWDGTPGCGPTPEGGEAALQQPLPSPSAAAVATAVVVSNPLSAMLQQQQQSPPRSSPPSSSASSSLGEEELGAGGSPEPSSAASSRRLLRVASLMVSPSAASPHHPRQQLGGGDAAAEVPATPCGISDSAASPGWGTSLPAPPATRGGALSCLRRCCASLRWAAEDTTGGIEPPPEPDRRVGRERGQTPPHATAASWRAWAAASINSLPAMIFFDAIIVANTVALLLQLSYETDTVDGSRVWGGGATPLLRGARVTELACLAIYVLEVGARLWFMGVVPYWRHSAFARLDLLFLALAVGSDLLEAGAVISDEVASALSFLRVLRLARLMRAVPGFGITVAAFGDILPVIASYACVLTCVFFAFAILGMECFAGKLSASNPAVAASSYGTSGLYALNYDNLGDAFAVLFYLLVNNDWPIIMEGATASVGRGARLYFIGFWLVCTVMCLNVLVAFVLDGHAAAVERRRMIAAAASGRRRTAASADADAPAEPTPQGIDDWRAIVKQSSVDFLGWRIVKKAADFDVHDVLYRSAVRGAFRETLSAGQGGALAMAL